MTDNEARAEIKRRWGVDGNGTIAKGPGGVKVYSVGKVLMGMMFMCMGSGKSWEDAFAKADSFWGKKETA